MGASSTTTLDFGAHPGAYQASVLITSQAGIVSGSLVEAWLYPVATSDHSIDEQLLDSTSLVVVAANINVGNGFAIYGQVDVGNAPLYGKYNVAWVWN